MKPQHNRRPHPRSTRHRRERQQGAVLFLVLMILVVTTLSATYAVQYSTANLTGTRGAQDALSARYAGESAANIIPGILENSTKETLEGIAENNQSLVTGADGGISNGFDHERLHVPPLPTTVVPNHVSNVQIDGAHYDGKPSLLGNGVDPRSPSRQMYEALIQTTDTTYFTFYTVTAWGRRSMGWDPAANDFVGTSDDFAQTDDRTLYHDSVSLARSYYADPKK